MDRPLFGPASRLAFRVAEQLSAAPRLNGNRSPKEEAEERDRAFRQLYTSRDLQSALKTFERLNG